MSISRNMTITMSMTLTITMTITKSMGIYYVVITNIVYTLTISICIQFHCSNNNLNDNL